LVLLAKLTAVFGVQRKQALRSLQQIDDQEAQSVEKQDRHRVFGPFHLALRIDARGLVGQALEPAERGGQEARLAGEHTRHEFAEGLGEREHRHQIEPALNEDIGDHEKSSGRNSAHTR
jgi:hypothetical protein